MTGAEEVQEEPPVREVRLRLAEDTYQEAMALARDQGWEGAWSEDVLTVVFAHGLAQLRGALARSRQEPEPADPVQRLQRALMDCEGRLAVFKYRAFRLERDNRALSFQVTGLEGENALLRRRLAMFRDEVESLKAQVVALQGGPGGDGVPAAARGAAPSEPASPGDAPRRGSWLGWLRRRVGRWRWGA